MFKGVTLVSWSRRDGQAGLLKPSAIWAGVAWALISMAFICTALMLWVFMTTHEVYHFSALIAAGIGLGALLGGAVSGRTAGYLGWLHGITVGFIYYLSVMLVLAVWSTGLPIGFGYGLVLLILAAAGGVVGVNLSVTRHSYPKNYAQR